MRKTAFFWGLLAMAALAPAARAFEAQLATGLDGLCAPNAPIPLELSLKGGARDFDGVVRLSVPAAAGGQRAAWRMEQPLLLPAGQWRRVRWAWQTSVRDSQEGNWQRSTPLALDGQATVGLYHGDRLVWRKTGEDMTLACDWLTQKQLAVGMGQGAGWLKGLERLTFAGQPAPPGQHPVAVAHVDLSAPGDAPTLAPARLVVVADVGRGGLTPGQIQALHDYAAQGGALVLTPGIAQESLTGQLMRELLGGGRLKVRQTPQKARLSQRPAPSSAVGGATMGLTVIEGGGFRPLIYRHHQPLLSHRRLGFGDVYWLSVDPSRPPWLGSADLDTVWRHLLAPLPRMGLAPTPLPWVNEMAQTGLFTAMPWLPLYLTLFVLALGPGQWWLLRHTPSPGLAWVTLPTLCLVFLLSGLTLMWLWPGRPKEMAAQTLIWGESNDRDVQWQTMGELRNGAAHEAALPPLPGLALSPWAVPQSSLGWRGGGVVLGPRLGQAGFVWRQRAQAPLSVKITEKHGFPWLSFTNLSEKPVADWGVLWPSGVMQSPTPPTTIGPGKTTVLGLGPPQVMTGSLSLQTLPTDSTVTPQAASHFLAHDQVLVWARWASVLSPPKSPFASPDWERQGQTLALWLVSLRGTDWRQTARLRRLPVALGSDLSRLDLALKPGAPQLITDFPQSAQQGWVLAQDGYLPKGAWFHPWYGGGKPPVLEAGCPDENSQTAGAPVSTTLPPQFSQSKQLPQTSPGPTPPGPYSGQATYTGVYNPLNDSFYSPCLAQTRHQGPYAFQDHGLFVLHTPLSRDWLLQGKVTP